LMNGEKSNDDWINGDDSKKSDKWRGKNKAKMMNE
jgi:hypothetical protein